MSPDIGEFSVRISLHVVIPALGILRWLLYFQKQKMCALVFKNKHEFRFPRDHPHSPDIRGFLIWRDLVYALSESSSEV